MARHTKRIIKTIGLLLAFCAFHTTTLFSQTTLNQGDVAILGMNANANCPAYGFPNGADVLHLVFFVDIEDGTNFKITDNAYQRLAANPEQWGNNEGMTRFTYNGPTTIPAGTVITFRYPQTYEVLSPATYNDWSFTEVDGSNPMFLNVAVAGDQLYIMQGEEWNNGMSPNHDATYTGNILYAWNTKSEWIDFANNNADSGLHPDVEPCYYYNPVSGNEPYSSYTGVSTPTTAENWMVRINDPDNWTSWGSCANYEEPIATLEIVDFEFEGIPDEICPNEDPISLPTTQTGIPGNWSGSGVSSNEFNPEGLSGTIVLTFTPLNDCLPEYFFEIEIIEGEIPTFTLDDEYCVGDTPQILPTTSTNGISGSWEPAAINTDDPGFFEFTFTPDDNCNEEFTLEVNIIENVIPVFDLNDEYCVGETPDPLPTTADNGLEGSWEPVSINTDEAGTFTYAFTPDEECSEEFTLEVNIIENVVPDFDLNDGYCVGETPQNLPTTSDNDIEGSWSPASISTDEQGTFTYTFTPDEECSEEYTLEVNITENVVPTFDLNDEYCVGETPQNLPATSDNGIEGSWSPAAINTDETGTFTYTFTPDDECSEEFTLEVNIIENVIPAFDLNDEYCVGETPQNLPSNSDNGIEGSWSPATINTDESGIFTYTFTPDEECSEEFTLEVNITENVTPAFDLDDEYCAGETPQNLPTTSNNGIEGIWNPASISTDEPGTFTYIFTPDEECSEEFILEITIHSLPNATASNAGPYCEGETINLSADGGEEYSWSGPNAFSSGDQNPIIPAASSFSSGEYTVTVTDENGCIATAITEVAVNDLPDAEASSNSPVCEGDDLELSASGGTEYEWTGPDGFNSTEQNPIIADVGQTAQGSYEVIVTNDDGCSESIELTVEVSTLPEINIDLIECDVDLNTFFVEFNTDGDEITVSDGILSDLGGGNYEVSEIDVENDLVIDVTNSATGCSSSFTVGAPDCDCPFIPVAVSGGNEEICQGDALPELSATTDPDLQINWFSQSVGGDTLAINSETYEPSEAGTFYAEVFDPVSGCTSTQRTGVSLVINPLPDLTINSVECSADLESYTVTFTTNAEEIENSAGTLVSLGGNNYKISGIEEGTNLTITVIIEATSCETSIEIESPNCDCPQLDAPVSDGDQTICEGDDFPLLSASVPSGIQINWYDSPIGGNLLEENSDTYQPNEAGTFYAETFDPQSDCSSQERTAISLIINMLPTADLISQECENNDFYTIQFETNATDIETNAGLLELIGVNQYELTQIPVGTDLVLELFDLFTDCENTVEFPFDLDCDEDCGDLLPPAVIGDSIFFVCQGEDFSELEAFVTGDLTIDWYDSPENGELLLSNSPLFTPLSGGNYYAETHDTQNNCFSDTRTAFQVFAEPEISIEIGIFNCEADSYTMELQITGDITDRVFDLISSGILTLNADGSITVSDVPQAEDILFESTHSDTDCSQEFSFDAPNCDCPEIPLPTGEQEYEVCVDEDFPTFELEVEGDLTINWYADSTGGSPLSEGSLSFTPEEEGIFYAEAIDTASNCVSERIAVALIINPLPQAEIVTTDCDDNEEVYSVTFSTDGNPANFWFTAGGIGEVINNPDGSVTVANIPVGQNVTVIVINTATSCENEYLVISPNCDCPDINPPTGNVDYEICEGDDFPTFELAVDSALTINWYMDATDEEPILENSLTFTPTQAGIFYAEAVDTANNCSSQRLPIVLTVNPNPSGEIIDLSCNDDGATYNLTFEVEGDYMQFIGSLGGGVFGAFDSTNRVNFPNLTLGQNYNFIVTNVETGCTSEYWIESPECDCPEINPPFGTTFVEICEGEDILSLELTIDEPGLIINWYDAPVNGNLLLENSLTFSPTEGGIFYAEAVDTVTACTSENRTAVELRVNPIPNANLLSIECDDSNEFYSVVFITDGNDEVFWTSIGGLGEITQPVDSVLTVTDIPVENDITILGVNIATGCDFRITIEAPDCDCPEISPPSGPTLIEICEGEEIPTLELSVDDPALTINWFDAPVNGNLLLENSLTFSPTEGGVFYAAAIDTALNCISDRIAVELVINPLPQAEIETTDCDLNEDVYFVTFSTDGNPANFWFTVGGIGEVNLNPDGSLTVANIPIGQNITLIVINTATGCENEYLIESPDCDCPDIPLPDYEDLFEFCEGDSLPIISIEVEEGLRVDWYDQMTGGELIAEDAADFVPPGPGTWYFELVDRDDECRSRIRGAVSVDEVPLPQIDLIEVICLESDLIEAFFEIMADSIEVNGADFELIGTELRIFDFQLMEEVEILLFNRFCQLTEIFREDDCPDDCNPLAVIQVTDPSCPGVSDGVIRIVETMDFDEEVEVFLNGEFFNTLDELPFDILRLDAGTYELMLNDGSCTLTEVITLNYQLIPTVEIITDATVVPSGSFTTVGIETNLTPDLIIWKPEELTTCTNCPEIDILVEDDINIQLSVVDSVGCQASANLFIEAFQEIRVFIPNVFSPNDDGINDTFRPYFPPDFNGIVSDFSIYNRWGERVFQLAEISANNDIQGWDGTYNGEIVNPAVFVYTLELRTPDGESEFFSGEVLILR